MRRPSLRELGMIAIILIWAFSLVDATLEGWEVPPLLDRLNLPSFPVWLILTGMVGSGAFSFYIAFSQRRRVMEDLPFLTKWIDARSGPGTYNHWCRQFRPTLLAIITSGLGGVGCLVSAFLQDPVSESGLVMAGCLIAACIGILAAYFLSRRHGPALE